MMSRPSRSQIIASFTATAALAPLPVFAQSGTIRIGTTARDPFFEPFVALDQGFFRQAGINADVTAFANTGATAQAVAAGALDTGLADILQIATAMRHGFPFALYAGGGLYSSQSVSEVLCVAKDSRFRVAKDLENQVIALAVVRSMTEASVQDWLQKSGADPSKVTFYELPYPQMLSALQRGTVAAAFLVEPFLSAASDRVRVIGNCYDAIAPSFYVSGWFAPRSWIERNAQVIPRLIEVIYKTARWINEHEAESAAVLAKYGGLNVDTIRSMKRTMFATSLEINLLQPVLDVAVRHHLLDEPMSARTLVASGVR